MGLINHDAVTLQLSGEQKTDTYITLGTGQLRLYKNDSDYILEYNYTGYYNQQARLDNRIPVYSGIHRLPITYEQLPSNMYNLAYAHLKTIYTNTTDEI